MFNGLIKNVSKDIILKPSFNLEHAIKQDVDVVFLHNFGDTALQRRKIRGTAKIEQIMDRRYPQFHTSKIKEYSETKNRPLLIGGVRGSYGLQKSKPWIKYFDAIHTSNKWLTDQCLKLGAKKSFVLYPGVDTEKFIPNHELRPFNHGWDFVVGWAGDSTKPCKNYHLLRELGFQYKTATKEYYTPYNEMPGFYNSCSAYVYMSTHEGCNRTILEASACGLPVVTSDVGAVREFIDDEWIVKTHPKSPHFIKNIRAKLNLLRLFQDLREEVGNRNRKNISKFAWPRVADRFEEILNEVKK